MGKKNSKVNEYMKEYRNRPEVKQKLKEYYQRPKVKQKLKLWRKEYNQNPRVKQKLKEYYQRPKVKQKLKLWRKEYNQNPRVKQKLKEYLKEYNQRPAVKARQKTYVCPSQVRHDFFNHYPARKFRSKEEFYKTVKTFSENICSIAGICEQIQSDILLEAKQREDYILYDIFNKKVSVQKKARIIEKYKKRRNLNG